MTHAKTVLLNQLLANANDRSWYVTFEEAVEGLSEQEADWKPDSSSHSISQIIQHLIYWNKVWILRYKRANVESLHTFENNNDSFNMRMGRSFTELKQELLDVLLQWQELLTEEQLDASVEGFPVEAEWWALIGNVATHNAYHIGQIAYIRKMDKTGSN